MPDNDQRSAAQKAADARYEEKRKEAQRLPALRLSEEQGALMESLYSLFDNNKKTALLAAVEYYLSSNEELSLLKRVVDLVEGEQLSSEASESRLELFEIIASAKRITPSNKG